jgi:hypothetical protein
VLAPGWRKMKIWPSPEPSLGFSSMHMHDRAG